MSSKIGKSNGQRIKIRELLRQRDPNLLGVDPLTLRFTDLRDRVMALNGFDDDPKKSNEPKLEAIQMAWYEEFKDAK